MRALALTLVVVVGLLGCEKSKTAPVAPVKVEEKKPLAGKAEVEFFGTWNAAEVKAARAVFVAQVEPCTPVPEKATRYGEEKLTEAGPLFAEFFIPQGSTGYACVYAFDEAGAVVGVASSSQNPMTFEGEGEVVKTKLEFTLTSP